MDLLVLSFSSSLHHHHYHFMHFKSKKNLTFIRLPFVTIFHISLFLSLSFRFCVDDLPLVVRTKTVEIKTNWLRYKKKHAMKNGICCRLFCVGVAKYLQWARWKLEKQNSFRYRIFDAFPIGVLIEPNEWTFSKHFSG